MRRRNRPARRPAPDPPLTPPPPPEVESLESLDELTDRAARIRRTSDALIRQMKALDARIADAKARRREGAG